jgi:hypothetical protein
MCSRWIRCHTSTACHVERDVTRIPRRAWTCRPAFSFHGNRQGCRLNADEVSRPQTWSSMTGLDHRRKQPRPFAKQRMVGKAAKCAADFQIIQASCLHPWTPFVSTTVAELARPRQRKSTAHNMTSTT